MAQRSINLVQLFKYSFQQYKKYVSFVFGAMLTLYVLAFVPQFFYVLRLSENPTSQDQAFRMVLMIVQLFLSLGFTKVMLLLVQNKYVEVIDMFNNFRPFLSYFVASFLYGLAVLIGLFLLILPGIFIAIRFQFYPYFILEEEDHAITALHKSYNYSHDLNLELFLFGVVVLALNIIGMSFLGIGILFTYPLTTMATAVIYKGLTAQADVIPTAEFQNQ
jgi:uncharacterized membrane protein